MRARPPTSIFDVRANESQATADSLWSPGDDCALQPLTQSFFTRPGSCDYLVRFSIGGVGQLVSGREGLRRQRQFQFVPQASLHRGSTPSGSAWTTGSSRRSAAIPPARSAVIADDLSAVSDRRKLWISQCDRAERLGRGPRDVLWIQDTWQAVGAADHRRRTALGIQPAAALVAGHVLPRSREQQRVHRPAAAVAGRRYRNFAPRLGAAWQLTRDGRTVLRAGGGLYYDSSMSIATDILNGGPLSITTLHQFDPLAGSSLLSYGFLPDLRLPYVGQWNVSLERAFGAQTVVSMGYVGSSARRLIRREMGGAGSTFTSLVALTTNHGASNYHGFAGAVPPADVAGMQAMVSYTWSHSIDNDSSDSFLLWAAPGPTTGAFRFRPAACAHRLRELRAGALKGWALDSIFRAPQRLSDLGAAGRGVSGHHADERVSARTSSTASRSGWRARRCRRARLNPAAFARRRRDAGHARAKCDRRASACGSWIWRCGANSASPSSGGCMLRIEAFNVFNHANFARSGTLYEQPRLRAVDLDAEYDARDRQPRQRPVADSADRRPAVATRLGALSVSDCRGASVAGVEIGLSDRLPGRGLARQPRRAAAPKTSTLGGLRRRETGHSHWRFHVHVHRLHPAAPQVGFMPEPGAAAVPQELLPPDAVWFGARPGLERRKIAPVLPHAEVPQGEQDVLMKEQAVRACLDRRCDPRAESITVLSR